MLEVDRPQGGLNFGSALGGDDPILAEVATQRIDQHGPLPDHKVAGLVRHQGGLLSLRLHRDEAHRGRMTASAIASASAASVFPRFP
jgi:hypothetical protein